MPTICVAERYLTSPLYRFSLLLPSDSMQAPKSIDSIHDIDFLRAVETQGSRMVDLGPISFIRPVGVVALLATVERLAGSDSETPIKITLPANQDVKQYLRLVGVFDAMREYVSIGGRQPEELIPETHAVRPMVKCKRFASEYDIETLSVEMENQFQTAEVGPSTLLHTCHTIFAELATNVVQHAESNHGYVLAQQYNRPSGDEVEIAVADCGIGIRASLQKNPSYSSHMDDTEAIEKALAEGVSSSTHNHRGYGLYHVFDQVREGTHREMVIRSGTGIVNVRGDGVVLKQHWHQDYAGTIVSVTIPISKN